MLKEQFKIPEDNKVLKLLTERIAYSKNARANLVEKMLATGVCDKAFQEFDIQKVSGMTSTEIIENHWNDIKVIRFRTKIQSIIDCAKALYGIQKDHGNFKNYMFSWNFPSGIETIENVDTFWNAFDRLQEDLSIRKMPFFKATTSLLHFLMDVGYDCIKPDMIAMRVAKNTGIVPKESGDKNLRKLVKEVQKYCINKNLTPGLIDSYLLIFGGQSSHEKYVDRTFCYSTEECDRIDYPVQKKGLCENPSHQK